MSKNWGTLPTLQKYEGCVGVYEKDNPEAVWDKINRIYKIEEVSKILEQLRKEYGLPEKFSNPKILDALFFTIGDKKKK